MVLSLIGSLGLDTLVTGSSRSSILTILQTALIAAGIYLVIKLVSYFLWVRKNHQIFNSFPGPKEWRFIHGSFENFPKDPHDRVLKFVEWVNTYGKERGYLRLWGAFCYPIILVCHPSSMKRILKTAEPKPLTLNSGYRILRDWLGEGLLIAGGQKWARNRRLLTPAFHFDILKPYVNVYNSSAGAFVDKLNMFADKGEQLELFQHVCGCTLDIILRCAFSYEIDVQRAGESHPYVIAVRDLAIASSARQRSPLLLPDFTYYLSSQGRKYKKDCDYVHGIAEEVILKRKAYLEKTGDVLEGRKYLDFLDILLTAKDETGAGLSMLDIRAEVDTFLFEGHDTTASAISWILYSLAEHQEYQQKCQEEIDSLLKGRESSDILWSDLQNLEYLTMCIKEGMRLHNPVPIIGRYLTKDLDLGDAVIPKDTGIMVNIMGLHHNEQVWGQDHWEFKPDRFSKENAAKMDPYQFVPFAGGPRNCIGQHFALNEEKTVIAKLLYNFTFKLVPGHVVKKRLAAVTRADNGILVYVERRQH